MPETPKTLMLIRHAESANRALRSQVWREVDRDESRFHEEYFRRRVHDPGLSERGRIQAKELAEHLVPELFFVEDQLVVITSPVLRALETAQPLIHRMQLLPERFWCHPELFEVNSSFPYRARRPSQLAATLEADFGLSCCELPDDAAYPERKEAERDEEADARVARTWAWLLSLFEDERSTFVVVIAHGQLISRWLQQLAGVPKEYGLRFAHGHTGITSVTWEEGPAIEYTNQRSHLVKGVKPVEDLRTLYTMLRRVALEHKDVKKLKRKQLERKDRD